MYKCQFKKSPFFLVLWSHVKFFFSELNTLLSPSILNVKVLVETTLVFVVLEKMHKITSLLANERNPRIRRLTSNTTTDKFKLMDL